MKNICFFLFFAHCLAAYDAGVTLNVEIKPRAAFTGERVVLKCLLYGMEGPHYALRRWYKNNRYLRYTYDPEFTINRVKHSDNATYHCEMKGHGTKWVSQKAKLLVTGDDIILQVDPLSVFEGDVLQLTCRYRNSQLTAEINFFKDGKHIDTLKAKSRRAVHKFTVTSSEDNGSYFCHQGRKYSKMVKVYVRELFSKPILRIKEEGEIFEALPLTLICHVEAISSNVHLQYTFYKDFEALPANLGTSELRLQAARLENTGMYSCQAAASTKDVQKCSDHVPIMIRELFSKPILRIDHAPELFEGEPLTLECFVQMIDFNILQYAFYKNGKALNTNPDVSETQFRATMPENSGIYFCEASSRAPDLSKKSDEVSISVKELFSEPRLQVDHEGEIFEGEPLVLTCVVEMISSNVILEYTFYKAVKSVSRDSNTNIFRVETTSWQDSGKYHCKASASSRAVRKDSNEVVISVNQIISTPILRAESATQLCEGETLIIICQVEMFQSISLKYAFYKDGMALGLSSDENHYITKTSWPDDTGVYQCEAAVLQSRVKKLSNQVSVSVRGIPVSKPVLTINPTKQLLEGDTVLLTCSVTNGSRPITYIFYKDMKNELYREESNLTAISYEIINVNRSSEGNYSCVAGNNAGELRLNSELIEVTIIVQNGATGMVVSVLSSLVLTALMALYFFRCRKQQSDSSSPSEPQGMVTGNGSQTRDEETAWNSLEYAEVGTAGNSGSTESATGVLYSELIIKEPSDYANVTDATGGKRKNAVDSSDYSIVYAPVNHAKMGAHVEADEAGSCDTNFYENFARK